MKQPISIFLILITSFLYGQSFDQAKMDSFLTHIESNQRGMGSLSIFQNGEEVYQNSIGYADIAKNRKANQNTKYRIGSITKTFTASIIMMLIEEGKLELSTKLHEYYPEVPHSEQITIEQLLRHRSGIFNFTSSADYESWMEYPITRDDLVAKIVKNGSSFLPDEKFEYSNSNYVLLSLIVEKIENKEFSDILKNRICEPCSLTDTYYGSKISPENEEALSYSKSQEWNLATETDMSIPLGAGAIVSSPTDLNEFFTCLFTQKLLPKNSLETMTITKDGMGIGLLQAPFYEKKAFGHNGGIDGFQSNAFYFPKENMSVAYLSNGVAMPMNDILIGALSIYFNKEYNFPIFKEIMIPDSEDLKTYSGVYASPSFPLKITISNKNGSLIAQATGQPSFALEAFERHIFQFDQAGIKMEFIPKENKMIFQQGMGKYELIKE